MSKIESLTDLFNLVECDATFYDIGRHISKLTPIQVMQFDSKQQPYPFIFRQKAWLAIVLTPKKSTVTDEPIIWFIRLEVDEKGCLNLGTRDHLIKTIVDKILTKDKADALGDALKDNPYAFQPDHERMASFHSKLSLSLEKQPSHFFDELVSYLKEDINANDTSWQALGLQGISDLAVRANQQEYKDLIKKTLLHAPIPLAKALAIALEHEEPNKEYLKLVEELFPATSNIEMKVALLRSISKAKPSKQILQSLKSFLNDFKGSNDELELIVSIVAKAPHWLNFDENLLHICMENLAHRDDGYLAFSQISSELSQIPLVRGSLWSLFRNEDRSQRLSLAIGSLFTKAPQQVQ